MEPLWSLVVCHRRPYADGCGGQEATPYGPNPQVTLRRDLAVVKGPNEMYEAAGATPRSPDCGARRQAKDLRPGGARNTLATGAVGEAEGEQG